MSANAGEDLRPIAKIASGGELARIMLALKNVLAEQESIATLVFDEVDTGVSGRAAQKVAEKLTQVGPAQAGALRDPSATAGRNGRHPFFRGKRGERGTDVHTELSNWTGRPAKRSWLGLPAAVR